MWLQQSGPLAAIAFSDQDTGSPAPPGPVAVAGAAAGVPWPISGAHPAIAVSGPGAPGRPALQNLKIIGL